MVRGSTHFETRFGHRSSTCWFYAEPRANRALAGVLRAAQGSSSSFLGPGRGNWLRAGTSKPPIKWALTKTVKGHSGALEGL